MWAPQVYLPHLNVPMALSPALRRHQNSNAAPKLPCPGFAAPVVKGYLSCEFSVHLGYPMILHVVGSVAVTLL